LFKIKRKFGNQSSNGSHNIFPGFSYQTEAWKYLGNGDRGFFCRQGGLGYLPMP